MGNQLNTCCAPCGPDGKPLTAGDMEEVRKIGMQKSGAAELEEKVGSTLPQGSLSHGFRAPFHYAPKAVYHVR